MKPAAPPIFSSLSLLLALLSSAALAQEEGNTEISIITPRSDARSLEAHRLKSADIAPRVPASSDTAGLLYEVPGVSLQGAGGVSSLPAIHGLADDRVNTQANGMGIVASCPNHMNPPLSYLDPAHVASARVYAGLVPVSVGGDSIGGTIQVNSAPPAFAAPGQGSLIKGEAGAFYRSNGKASGGNVEATVASESLSMRYAASRVQSGDYRAARDFKPAATSGSAYLPGDVVGSSYFKSINQDLLIALRHENHLLELDVSKQDIPYEGFPNQRMDITGNAGGSANLHYTGKHEWGTLEARAYSQWVSHSMNFGRDKVFWYGMPPTAPGMPMNSDGRTTGAKLDGTVALNEADTLRVGAEVQKYRLNDWWPPSGTGMMMSPNTFWNISNGHRDRLESYGEWESRWNPRWTSLFGVRGGTVSMRAGAVQGYSAMYAADANAFNAAYSAHQDRNWDMTALARYTPDETQAYEFGYSRKSHSPNLYQLYTWSTTPMAMEMNNFAGDGNGYVGNLNLRPEVAHTLSATLDWHDAAQERWGAQFTPYFTIVENYIDAQRCGPVGCGGAANLAATTSFVNLQYVNQRARLYGMDFSGRMPIADTAGYGSFSLKALAGYTRGVNTATGDNLYNIMPLNGRIAVEHKLGGWTSAAELQLVAAKTNVSRVRNEMRTQGYGLINLRASYEQKRYRLDVGVDNLLNRFYAHPLGGAYIGQGATMMQNGMGAPAWGTPVPGMGRSLYVGLKVRF